MQPLDKVAVPTFISKLWKMVNDSTTNDIICWSSNGRNIMIFDEAKLWYRLLPRYYKHHNMSSFTRQLNMYGFHKVSNILECNTDIEKNPIYQFVHPYFQMNQLHLLKNIKRKVGSSKISSNSSANDVDQFDQLLCDFKSLSDHQNRVDSVLNNLQQENAILWQEVVILQQKQQKYQQILNKLIQFLVTFVQPSSKLGEDASVQRPSLMIQDDYSKKLKPVAIHELDNADIFFKSKDPDMNVASNKSENPITSFETDDCMSDTVNEITIESSPTEETDPDPTIKLLTELELSDDLGTIPPLDISSVLRNNRTKINLENLKYICLNSTEQDPLLTSILNDSDYGIKTKTDFADFRSDIYDHDNTNTIHLTTTKKDINNW